MSGEPATPPTGQPEDMTRERQEREGRLEQSARSGRLTLGEYAGRAEALARAATISELDAAVQDIPDEPVAPARPLKSWLVGILGGTEARGRWRLGRKLVIVAIFGGARLDLGNAQLEAPESMITIIAFFGGVELTAPPGVPIALSGVSLLGGRSDERSADRLLSGAPRVLIRAFAILGGVKVKAFETEQHTPS